MMSIITQSYGQESYKQIKKDLKSLGPSAYIQKCFDGAKDLSVQKKYDDAIELLDKAYDKGKEISTATAGVIVLNKVELIYDFMPRTDRYGKEVVNTLKLIGKNNPNEELLNDLVEVNSKIQASYSASINKQIQSINSIYLKDIIDIRQDRREENLKAQIKEFNDQSNSRAYAEYEKLKKEREALQKMHTRLNETINRTERKLNSHANIINQMTKEKAKKEAILQYNMRIIDSLNFLSQLDSLALLNNEYLIAEQSNKLSLQQSELLLKESELELKNSQRNLYLVLSLLGLLSAGCLALFFWNAKRTNKELELKNQQIEEEKERSEELLLNILPKFVAQELKESSRVETRLINQCTVLFTDFINFSSISKTLSPHELIAALDECFRAFDEIISKFQIEKIKTIGDAYMCAGGVPVPNDTHAIDAVNAAKEMVKFLDKWNAKREKKNLVRFDARIGIHTGPIIAGVVGMKKFAYDIWGDTVNVAARLESTSEASKINISSSTYELIKEQYSCTSRGDVKVKNMKNIEMYFVDKKLKTA